MISITRLREAITDDHVVFDAHGAVIEEKAPVGAGAATVVVSEVTEALKRVDSGMVGDPVDRDEMWSVDKIVLRRDVLERINEETVEWAGDLVDLIRDLGYVWEVSSTSSI